MRVKKGCLQNILVTSTFNSRSNNGGRFVVQHLECGHTTRKRKSAVPVTAKKSQCWTCAQNGN